MEKKWMSWRGCWDYRRKDGRFENSEFVWDEYMKVKLKDVCIRDSSNLKQSDVLGKDGEYPIYGAAGYIGNVEFYHQENHMLLLLKMEQELEEHRYVLQNLLLLAQCNI